MARKKIRAKPRRKKIDIIVTCVCLYWVLFIIAAWVTFWIKESIPDTLIQYGLGGGAVELVLSAIIEIKRDKSQKKKGDNANEQIDEP